MRVVLQMGHVARRRGATGTTGEQDYARAVCAAAAAMLRALGHESYVIGADDPVPRRGAEAFVAVHADGSTSPRAGGASFGYRAGARGETASRAMGQLWARTYQRMGWPGGFRPVNYTTALARYYGVARAIHVGIPRAIILEGGFLTNPGEARWMRGPGIAAMAQAIVAAVTGREADPPRNPPTPGEGLNMDIATLQTAVKTTPLYDPDGAGPQDVVPAINVWWNAMILAEQAKTTAERAERKIDALLEHFGVRPG